MAGLFPERSLASSVARLNRPLSVKDSVSIRSMVSVA